MEKYSQEYITLHDYFCEWAKQTGVMDNNGMIWSQCYQEDEELNEGEDDGSYDWGGSYYGGCSLHNDGDW